MSQSQSSSELNPEKLTQSSKEELVQMILIQQTLIEELQEQIGKLKVSTELY